MQILNKVKDTPTTDVNTFLSWQFNDLKDKDRDVTKLKQSILKSGWSFPVFVWETPQETDEITPDGPKLIYYVIDGTGRKLAALQLISEGHTIPEIPFVRIEAKDLHEAKQKVLEASSQFGGITEDSFLDFTQDIEVQWDTLEIPDVNEDMFTVNDFEPTEPLEEKPGKMKVDKSCPQCGYVLQKQKDSLEE